MATFKFSVEELDGIAKTLPEDQDNIRLLGRIWAADGETLLGGPDAVKCGGCNWNVEKLFVEANTKEAAIELLKDGDAGMCGECFAEYLSEKQG